MQHLPWREVARRAVRGEVCVQCHKRPPGSETLGNAEPRSCEGACSIFLNLDTLIQIAGRYDDPTLRPYERAVRELVCQHCEQSPTSGDFCEQRTNLTCPLNRYAHLVVDALQAALTVNPSRSHRA